MRKINNLEKNNSLELTEIMDTDLEITNNENLKTDTNNENLKTDTNNERKIIYSTTINATEEDTLYNNKIGRAHV